MEDEYSVKLRVDTSELTMAAQQAQLMAYSAAASAGQNGLSPITSIANSAFSQAQNAQYGASGMSPMMASMASPFSPNMAMMSPFQHMGQGNFTTPQGFLAGTPVGPQSYASTIPNILGTMGNMGLRSFANSALGGAVDRYFPSLGISSMGLYGGGGRLDLPVFRAQQMASERFAESVDKLYSGAAKIGTGAAIGALGLGSLLVPGLPGFALGMAGFGIGQTADYAFNVQEKYLELGDYFRDAMGASMKNKLGGGANHHQAAEFMRGMGKQVANDKYLVRDDYNLLVQTGTELGFMQSVQTPEAALHAVENIAKSVKTMAALGTKLVDMQKDMELMRGLGIDLSRNQSEVARFMGTMGFNAFSANMSTSQMLQTSAQASPLFSSMGLAPTIGASIHSQSLAMAGEAIRMGGFSIADQAYYGGKEGMAEAQSRAIAAINRTGLGQVSMLGAMADPGLASKMLGGRGSMQDIIGSYSMGMDATKYSDLFFRMPQFSQEMNPNQFGMAQVATMVNSLKEGLGGKISSGELAIILSKQGMSPDDARLLVRQIEEAPETLRGMRQSTMNYAAQQVLESYRPPANIFNNPAIFFQKVLERNFDPMLSGWAAAREEMMGGIEHAVQHTFMGKYIDPTGLHTVKLDKSLVGLAGVENAIALYMGSPEDRQEVGSFLDRRTEELTRKNIRTRLAEEDPSAQAELVAKRKQRYKTELDILSNDNLVEGMMFRAPNLASLGTKTTIKDETELNRYIAKLEYEGLTQNEQNQMRAYLNSRGVSGRTGLRLRSVLKTAPMNLAEENALVADVLDNAPIYSGLSQGLEQSSLWGTLTGSATGTPLSEEGTRSMNRLLSAPINDLQAMADRLANASPEDSVVVMSQLALGDTGINAETLKNLPSERLNQVGQTWERIGKRTKGAGQKAVLDRLRSIATKAELHGKDDAVQEVATQYETMKKNANTLLRTTGLTEGVEGRDLALVRAAAGERLFSAEYEEGVGPAERFFQSLGRNLIPGGKGNKRGIFAAGFSLPFIGHLESTMGELSTFDTVTSEDIEKFLETKEEREEWRQVKNDPEARKAYMDRQLARFSEDAQRELGSSPSDHKLGIKERLGQADITAVSKYGGKLANADKVSKQYAYTMQGLKEANTRELRKFFNIGGSDEMEAITTALANGETSEAEFKSLLRKASNAKAKGKTDLNFKGVKDLSALALQITEGLGETEAAEAMTQVLEKGFGWGDQDKAAEMSAQTMAMLYDKDKKANTNIAAVTGSLVALAQTKEEYTDRLMIDPKGKGGYLGKEQIAGIQQASASIAQQAEVVKLISDSVEKVPKHLDEFRKEFKKDVLGSEVNRKLLDVLNKIDGKLVTGVINTQIAGGKPSAIGGLTK